MYNKKTKGVKDSRTLNSQKLSMLNVLLTIINVAHIQAHANDKYCVPLVHVNVYSLYLYLVMFAASSMYIGL